MYIATASYGCVSAVDAAETDRMSSPWLFGARPQSSRMSIATAVTPLGRVWQQGVTVAAIDLVRPQGASKCARKGSVVCGNGMRIASLPPQSRHGCL
jgi:hypothetical protein